MHNYLQKQKSYIGIRQKFYLPFQFQIYKSRNLIQVLDYQRCNQNQYIYKSRNLIQVLDFFVLSTWCLHLQKQKSYIGIRQSSSLILICFYLQKQKSYIGIRLCERQHIKTRIYKSRNLIQVLDQSAYLNASKSTKVEILYRYQTYNQTQTGGLYLQKQKSYIGIRLQLLSKR